jgi:NAD(P)-dependent dehydrogenase (short-subunit alcohol dehydrogenase family)
VDGVTGILRPGALAGVTVLAAPATALAGACATAGAEVVALAADLLDEAATEAATTPCDVLLVDAGALFGAGGPEALRRALDGAWSATRAVAARHLIAAGRGGKVVLVAPRPAAGPHAGAARAGLENLARTTSIEWARHAITPTAILPGPETADAEVAEVVAYLAAGAGDYFSGCALALG